ncbi:MAG: adenosine kinase [Actinomycetota bacterium]|nr:adenosine kinase [Actinomycetota bacterium]MEC9467440.1 adenosine kinase [Actinomycetota bacterium]MED6327881.1 adenosine kinase [Actinomycetota bacterium]MEE2958551.1 adenosine kinase [Actinomycetota bacterium]
MADGNQTSPNAVADLDVVGVGNAIVDVLAEVDDAFIVEHDLAKGAMTLIDTERALELYAAMPPGLEESGGSAANTMVGVASFGGSAAYVGKVADDFLGEVFRRDMRHVGVGFDVLGVSGAEPTARCLIQVTPDAQRTMNTHLGISSHLSPEEIDGDLVASASHLYCEGYLWDTDEAKAAIRHAMDLANAAGRTVSLTLSDGFCVDRHRDEWRELLAERVDVVFGNAGEVCSLFEVDDVDTAADLVSREVDLAFVTLGKQGSMVVQGSERIRIEADELEVVVDTTGAGDLYAAGVLFGLSQGADLPHAARLGSIAAAEVISHLGARPGRLLSAVAASILG